MTGWCCGFVVESNRVEFAAELWLRDIFDSGIFLAFGINPAEHPPRLSHIAYLYLVVQTRLKIYPASSRGGCPSYGALHAARLNVCCDGVRPMIARTNTGEDGPEARSAQGTTVNPVEERPPVTTNPLSDAGCTWA